MHSSTVQGQGKHRDVRYLSVVGKIYAEVLIDRVVESTGNNYMLGAV